MTQRPHLASDVELFKVNSGTTIGDQQSGKMRAAGHDMGDGGLIVFVMGSIAVEELVELIDAIRVTSIPAPAAPTIPAPGP